MERVRQGYRVVDEIVSQETLAAICARRVPADQPVHFLKIDVEGAERDVILGGDWGACRPWIVVVEATRPNTQEPSHGDWEDVLTNAGYGYAYGDGLNRFYVAAERTELRPAFAHPPNVFDGFVTASEVESGTRAALAEQQVTAIKTGRTWRYTRPLRVAARRTRRARNKGRRLASRARRAVKRRLRAIIRRAFPIVRGNPRLRHRAAVLRKVPGVSALYRRIDRASTPAGITDLSPRAQRIFRDLTAPGRTRRRS